MSTAPRRGIRRKDQTVVAEREDIDIGIAVIEALIPLGL